MLSAPTTLRTNRCQQRAYSFLPSQTQLGRAGNRLPISLTRAYAKSTSVSHLVSVWLPIGQRHARCIEFTMNALPRTDHLGTCGFGSCRWIVWSQRTSATNQQPCLSTPSRFSELERIHVAVIGLLIDKVEFGLDIHA